MYIQNNCGKGREKYQSIQLPILPNLQFGGCECDEKRNRSGEKLLRFLCALLARYPQSLRFTGGYAHSILRIVREKFVTAFTVL
jgi:hypothetical protein